MRADRTTYKDEVTILFGWQRKKWLSKKQIARTVGCAPSTVAQAFCKLRSEGRQVNMRWNRDGRSFNPGSLGCFEYNLQRRKD